MSEGRNAVLVIHACETEFVPASHEDPNDPGVLKRVIAVTEQFHTGQVRMLNWARLPPGKSFQDHYHEDMQEVFVMLTGRVVMFTRHRDAVENDEESHELAGGDAILIPPTIIHRMENTGETTAEYIVFGISAGTGGRTIIV